MSFANAALHLRGNAPGELNYFYDASADTLAAVLVASYMDNVVNNLKLVAGDFIFVKAADGSMNVKVSSVAAAGPVTLQFAGGDLPINTFATGTDATLAATPKVGYMEVGTGISTASRVVLPTPYVGAVFHVYKAGSGTAPIEFDAGGSGATGITYDGTRRRITLIQETTLFRVRGTSATRWRIEELRYNASAVSEGGSVVFLGT